MNVLNLYFSSTGNTEKVASRIKETARELGHYIDSIKIASKEIELDIITYDFVFIGSGVYVQLPGEPLVELFRRLNHNYIEKW